MNYNKLIFWIIAVFFLAVPMAFALTDQEIIDNYIAYDSGDQVFITGNTTVSHPSDTNGLNAFGWTYTSGSLTYDDDGEKLGNMSIYGAGGAGIANLLFGSYTNVTYQASIYDEGTAKGIDLLQVYNEVAGMGINHESSATHYYYREGAEAWTTTGIARSVGWHNLTYYINNSQIHYYIDGTWVNVYAVADTMTRLKLFHSDSAAGYQERWYDDIKVWNGTPQDEMSGGSSPPVPNTLNVYLISPANNTITNNQSIRFYFNVTGDINASSVMLYHNFTEPWHIADGNNSPVMNATMNILDNGFTNGQYIWGVCANISNGSVYCSENRTLTIDTTQPAIASNIINKSSIYNSLLTARINLTDDNLHSMNISFDNILLFNITNIAGTFYEYNLSYSTTTAAIGWHLLNITAADGHTAESIKEYDVGYGLLGNKITYKTSSSQITIAKKDGSMFDRFTTQKLTDKYTFAFSPSSKSSDQILIVTSNNRIIIKNDPSTAYKTWLITGNNWIDFYTPEHKDISVSIKQIDAYNVEVTLINSGGQGLIKFDSIGDLNINSVVYSIYVGNATETYSNPVLETSTQQFKLNVSYDSSSVSDINAALIYNLTTYSATKTNYSNNSFYFVANVPIGYIGSNQVNYTFYWQYNITNITYNTTLKTQSVNKILFDNCALYNVSAVNFTSRKETNKNLTGTTMVGYFELWTESYSLNRTFNVSWTNNSRHSLCLPTNATYNIYAQLEYQGTEAEFTTKRTYYLYNTTISNDTKFVDIYVGTNTTQVLFTVTDSDDNAINGLYIQVLKYDFGTNSYVISEILKTDDSGHALGNIVLYNDWYKFNLIYNGALLLTSEPVKIITTSRNFRVNLLSDYFTFYDRIQNIATDLTFNNVTNNFVFTWANPEGTSVNACLTVKEQTPVTEVQLNKTCTSSASGTILINIGTDTDGKVYSAQGSIQLNPTFETELLKTSFLKNAYKVFGKDGLVGLYLIRVAVAMIGIWNPVIAIILILLVDIGLIVANMYSMSWSVLIVYIVLAGLVIYKMRK